MSELRLQGLELCHGLGRDLVNERSALRAGEHERIELPGDLIVGARQDQSAARSAQRLVRRGGHHVGVRQGVRVDAGRHQPRHVRHVDDEVGADALGDGGEARPVDDARVGGKSGDDHLRPVFFGEPLHLLVIDLAGVGTDAVLRGAKELAGKIHARAVSQVTAVVKTHAENRIPGLHQREIRRRVRLRAGMRLHVRIVGAEEFPGALDGECFGDVDKLATTVVALAGIAFRVLVGKH